MSPLESRSSRSVLLPVNGRPLAIRRAAARRAAAVRPAIALAGFLSLIFLFAGAPMAWAQGVLVNITPGEHVPLPRTIIIHPGRPHPTPPPQSYKIKELSVETRLVDQVARTQVNQSFVNTGSAVMEVSFVFPLPYDGAIDQLTLLVDGKEYAAKLLPAPEARRIYEDIVRKNRDPALLEWIGNGMFQTSVFPVPPGAERKVTLRYSQLCRKNGGLTDYLFPLSTAKYTSAPVESVRFNLSIESNLEIKNVYSPTHAVEVKRPDNHHATVSYHASNQTPSGDFRLFYDVGAGQLGASLLSFRPKDSEDGYFLLLASPEIKPADAETPKKTVMFVVDRSGSMSGPKIEQAKGAMTFVLNNLREGDLFNVIAYDSQIESFRPELQKFNPETRAQALGFVNSLYAGGSTNIDGAMQAALAQLKDSSRPNFVIFLTDGLPTAGETNEAKIVAAAKASNAVHARLFAFGVGYDVNSRLLDKLVRENFGQSEYVRPNENIEAHVSALYSRIDAPVMTNLAIHYDLEGLRPEDGPAVTRAYPADAHDLFAGEQLVVVGRYRKAGAAKVTVSGKVGAEERKFDFPATFVAKSTDDSSAFIEKLWAIRRVGQIIDEIDLKGKNDELVKELVDLATRHGVLTPYTAFLADDSADRHDMAGNTRQAGENVRGLERTDGESGFAQRRLKGSYQRAAQPAAGAEADAVEEAAKSVAAPAPALRAIAGTPHSPSTSSGHAGYAGGRLGLAGANPDAPSSSSPATPDHLGQRVQSIGRKTFYRQGDRWIDAAVDKDQQAKAVKIERFSAEYFSLIEKNGPEVAKYLAIDEPLTVEIGGQAYEF